MTLVVPTTKSPVISTFPVIVPPVSSYLLSIAVCNPLVLAMVKFPSFISSCFVPIYVCNPFVLAKVKSPSSMVSYFVPISVNSFTPSTKRKPNTSTLPVIAPPVSSYLLSNTVCNPDVFAMVKSPSCIVSCFP